MISKIQSFLGEAFFELRRVNWPTRQQTVRLTIVVIIMSLLVAIVLGIFDFVFTNIIDSFVI
ncbi:MAG: preprotein translocase subunit SecE [Candidatus Liptonbacteria bacterium CG11_big_fil_rev_8_21_14_0_20_35_14]|uniref:Protein translocase subunit SecE n=1 Tax=Candidatus Liptonbacteria bacterium CG11_big_fil_rev_8_21_14_0_20_35_14 TaxID=1974634 RepID=A0A2H0N8G0_9BACT|nr:MAG: preprotein translocase subunit SecE [Candidatus Liptonbacteria bacterium CG11_big_fil_rev_8_21_14_0_20_35_14]